MWELVMKKFDINQPGKKWIMKSLEKKWKDWKASIKAKYFDADDVPTYFGNPPERVIRTQWENLVLYWNSEVGKKRSAIYKKNRANQKFPHTTGTKSFAQIREEHLEKRADGSEPTQAEIFIETHKRKPGKDTNEATLKAISKINTFISEQPEAGEDSCAEEDILSQAIGKDTHSHVRTYGLGPSCSDVWGKKSVDGDGDERTTFEASLIEENEQLRSELHDIKGSYARMESKLDGCMKLFERLLSGNQQFQMVNDMNFGARHVPSTSNPHSNSLQPRGSYSSSSHEPQSDKGPLREKTNAHH